MHRRSITPFRYRRLLLLACAPCSLSLMAGCSGHNGNSQGGYQDAVDAVSHNDYATADKILKQALQDNHQDSRALLLAGKVALEVGDAQRAASLLEELAQRDAKANPPQYTAQIRPLLAKAQLDLNNLPGALHTLGNDYMADPVSCAVEVRALSAAAEYARAIDVLDKGLAAFPHAVDLQVLDGLRAQALGHTDHADAIAAEILKAAPDDINALIYAGQLALSEHRMEDAKRIFSHAHDLRPGHQTPILALASIARDTGDTAAEKQWVDLARQKGATSPAMAGFAAELALQSDHADEADKILTHVGELGPVGSPLRLIKGLTDAKLNRQSQAIDELSAYLSHGGNDDRARLALAVLLTQKGDKARAWQALKPLADAANATEAPLQLAVVLANATHDPGLAGYTARLAALKQDNPRAMTEAGAAINAGDWHKADAIYTQLLASGQGNRVIMLNNAAYVKINLGDAAGAVTLARQATALAPNDPIVMDTLGWALFKSAGATSEATQLLARAAGMQPGNATIRQHLVAAQAAGK